MSDANKVYWPVATKESKRTLMELYNFFSTMPNVRVMRRGNKPVHEVWVYPLDLEGNVTNDYVRYWQDDKGGIRMYVGTMPVGEQEPIELRSYLADGSKRESSKMDEVADAFAKAVEQRLEQKIIGVDPAQEGGSRQVEAVVETDGKTKTVKVLRNTNDYASTKG